MADALAVLVLVLASETARPATPMIAPAIARGARSETRVVVREVDDLPADADVAFAADGAHLVVEVVWGEQRDHVGVRLLHANGTTANTTDMDFRASEPWRERGRSVGFAIAAMLPATTAAPALIATSFDPEALVLRAAPSEPAAAAPASAPPAPAAPARPNEAPSPAPAPRARPFTVGAALGGLVDGDRGVLGMGPSVVGEWSFARGFAARLGGDARWLSIGSQTSSEIGARAGIRWRFAESPRLAFSLLFDGLGARDAYAAAPRSPHAPQDHASWVFGGAIAAEGALHIMPSLDAFLATGVDVVKRKVEDPSSVDPAPVWLTTQAGARLSF